MYSEFELGLEFGNTAFDINRTFELDYSRKITYYKDLSKLPDYLLKDLSNEKLDGVKTVGLKFNPTKLPDGYISLKTIENKYNGC